MEILLYGLRENISVKECETDTHILIHANISGPFYQHGLTLIPAWISNYIHYKVWDELTYPFLNFNGCTVEV